MARLLAAAAAALAATSASALDIPTIYGSHQVFQRGQPIQLWGTDDAASVTVNFLGTNYPSAVSNGRWNVTLPAQQGSTQPTTITISSASGAQLSLTDVAFGDVFVCSGQSNMQLSVLATVNQSATQAGSAAYGQYLRLFQVALEPAYVNTTSPQSNLTASIPWSQAGPNTVLGMSAMCYFYGTQLVDAYPGTYVGLIDSSWGGTAIEVWMSGAALTSCGEGSVHAPLPGGDTPAAAAWTGAHKWRGPGGLPSLPFNAHGGVDMAALAPAASSLAAVYPSKPSCLYNSMITPLLPLAAKGFLWYQGEANTGNPVGYSRCFPAMITQWRGDWAEATGGTNDPTAPFLFAQLAAWPNGDTGAIAVQRYAQEAALALPKVGMAVAGDISDPAGSFHPIHPPWKAELARRAWLWADAVIYGNASSPTSGPRPVSVALDAWDSTWGFYHFGIQGGVCAAGSGFSCYGIRVKFDQPLVLRSLFNAPSALYGGWTGQDNGMELLPSTNTSTLALQPVSITGVRSDDPYTLQLNVTWVAGGVPGTLRYGWHDYPTLPLANAAGLPVPPFNITVPWN